MKLVAATDEAFTIRFERKEFANLRAIVHSAAVEYENLTGEIHNLSKGQVEKIETDLYSLT